jgi:hypothetical protein
MRNWIYNEGHMQGSVREMESNQIEWNYSEGKRELNCPCGSIAIQLSMYNCIPYIYINIVLFSSLIHKTPLSLISFFLFSRVPFRSGPLGRENLF